MKGIHAAKRAVYNTHTMELDPYREEIARVVKYAEEHIERPRWHATKAANRRAADRLFDDPNRMVVIGNRGCLLLVALKPCGHFDRHLAVKAPSAVPPEELRELALLFGFACKPERGTRINMLPRSADGGWIYAVSEHEPHGN